MKITKENGKAMAEELGFIDVTNEYEAIQKNKMRTLKMCTRKEEKTIFMININHPELQLQIYENEIIYHKINGEVKRYKESLERVKSYLISSLKLIEMRNQERT